MLRDSKGYINALYFNIITTAARRKENSRMKIL